VDEVYYIEKLEQLKVISDPFRIKILWELDDEAKTGKMLADSLGLPPSKMRYHLTELQKAGLIVIEKTEVKNGIVQKFFRPIAKMISLEKILPAINGGTLPANALIENAIQSIEKTKLILRKWESTDHLNPNNLLQSFETLSMTEEEFQDLKSKLRELTEPYRQKNTIEKKLYHLHITAFPKSD